VAAYLNNFFFFLISKSVLTFLSMLQKDKWPS
jgi:hypothetical protein